MTIPDLLTELGIPFKRLGEHHHATSKYTAQVDCPWCSPGSGKYRMGINSSWCACWSCGPHRLWETLAELSGRSTKELSPLLKGLQQDAPALEAKHAGKLVLPKGLGPMSKAHRDYLRRRGFDPAKIERLWRVQGINHLGGWLKWRLFIPVYQHGELVTWTARAIGRKPGVKRYIAALQANSLVPRNKVLYGQDYARHAVICVEGAIDVWAIGPGAVACLGTAYSEEQFAMLLKYPIRAVAFDNQPEAQARARQLVDKLCAFPGETINLCLDAKDPATAPKKDIRKIREMVGL